MEANILIVGAGFWGKRWIEVVQAHPALRLVGVVTGSDASAAKASAELNIPRDLCSADLHRAIAAVKPDIVVIVSPPPLHEAHVAAAIAHADVICEKPLAHDWTSAIAIAKAVRAQPQRHFMVAQTRRFTQVVAALHDFVRSGKLGAIDHITFDHRVNFTGGGYRYHMDLPVIEDMICHHLDALRYITGAEPESVYVEGWNPAWSQFSGKASNHVLATLRASSGAETHLNYFGSWTSRGQLNSYDGVIQLMGANGSLRAALGVGQEIVFYRYTGQEQGTSPMEKIEPAAMPLTEVQGVLDSFLAARSGRTPLMCGIDDNLRTFAFTMAALEACRRGHPVRLRGMHSKMPTFS